VEAALRKGTAALGYLKTRGVATTLRAERLPRCVRQVRHDLSELLTVAVFAVLCSADEFSDIQACARERIDWLRDFLVLEHGIIIAAIRGKVRRRSRVKAPGRRRTWSIRAAGSRRSLENSSSSD